MLHVLRKHYGPAQAAEEQHAKNRQGIEQGESIEGDRCDRCARRSRLGSFENALASPASRGKSRTAAQAEVDRLFDEDEQQHLKRLARRAS